MQQSKPGIKLNPLIASKTTPIFEADPKRYQRICRWVWTQQKRGWPDEAIAEALSLAGTNIHRADSWWKYLTALLPKGKGRAAEIESTRHKSEVGEIAGEFVEFLKQKRGAK